MMQQLVIDLTDLHTPLMIERKDIRLKDEVMACVLWGADLLSDNCHPGLTVNSREGVC